MDEREQGAGCGEARILRGAAFSRRYARETIEPDGFARHYEDVAHIIRSFDRLPAVEQSPRALADEMLGEKDIAAIPSVDEPALVLADSERRAGVERALARIQTMFWGARIPVDEPWRRLASGFGRTLDEVGVAI